MSTLSKIDPSTLGWVKSEIDETLKQARLAIEAYTENTADDSQLRYCLTYLHQVLGTLQMVELDGAAMLARESEALAESVLNGSSRAAGSQAVEVLIRGLLTLPDYLARLQHGQPDAPLRLLPLLNELRSARGAELLSEHDLFQPDLDVRPPKIEGPRPSDSDFAARARSLRPAFQATLLNWLRETGNRQHLDELAVLISQLQQEAPLPPLEQLFWVAGGYADLLAAGAVEPSNDRKKLFARLEQQLKKISDGADRSQLRNSSESLTRSMLYEVGQAHPSSGRAGEIRRAFALDALLPGDEAEYSMPTPEALQSVSEALGKEIEQAQDLLSTYFEQGETSHLETLAPLLRRMAGTLEMLNVELLKVLVEELAGLCDQLASGELEKTDSLSMPMASALLLLEHSARDIQTLGMAWKRQVEEAIAGLRRLRAGEAGAEIEGIELTDTSLSDSEFKQLVGAVGGEIRVNLGKIEEVLETFAANTDQVEVLEPVPQHLSQIQGAMQILGQDRAAALVAGASRHVQAIRDHQMGVDSAILDALAVTVGSIGAYVEGLERDRPNLDMLLTNASRDLGAALTGKRAHSGNPEALIDGIEQNLTVWLADYADRRALAGLQQDLRDLAWVAESQQQERIGKICSQMISLLEMVESGEVSGEIETTLRQSYDALATLTRGQLQNQPLAKAPPRASSRDKAESVTAVPVAMVDTSAAASGDEAEDDDIIQIFIEDAREMIALINRSLPDWQADPDNRDALLDLRRAFHTLKGSGRMVGASEIAEFAWSVENMLNKVRENKIAHSETMFDLLGRAREVLPEMVVQLEGGPATQADVPALRAIADALAEGRPAGMPANTPAAAPPAAPGPRAEAPSPATAAATGGEPPADQLPQLDDTLLQIFSTETRGHAATVRSEAAKCRDEGFTSHGSDGLVRAVHTLQGSARAVGLKPMAEASAELEKLLQTHKSHDRPLDESAFALFDRLTHSVEQLIDALNRGETTADPIMQEFRQIRQAAHEDNARLGVPETLTAAPVRAAPVEPPRAAPPPAPEPPPVQAPAAKPAPRAAATPAANDVVVEKLDPELLEIFLEEATDIMAAIEDSLARWRSQRGDRAAVAELKRQLHTLKGGARMSGAMTMGSLGHNTESLLGEVEAGRTNADSELMDLMDEVHDALVTMIEQMQNRKPVTAFSALNNRLLVSLGQAPAAVAAPAPAPATRPEPLAPAPALMPELPDTMPAPPALTRESGAPAIEPPVHETAAPASEFVAEILPEHERRADGEEAAEAMPTADRRGQVRVRTSLLNELVNSAGEVSISRARMEQQIFGMRENLAELNRNVTRFRDQIRELEIQSESQMLARAQAEASRSGEEFDPLELDRFSRLQTLSRSLAENLHDLFTIRGNLENYASQAETVLLQQARINTDLQEGLMRTRMIGFATQSARLRHIVRQTGREVGKRVDLELIGGEVEVDRTVLERMIGPFEHMVRNAIDHGIEPEAERRRAGKPATGKITIDSSHEGTEIVIRFSDDGAGLDTAAIRRKAVERGLLKSGVNLSDDELIQFILMPGFSTAGKVTHLSGRGVGMDVVHTEVKQLGGSITVDTRRGAGTTFIIRLPLTLSISQALMVYAGEQLYALPLSSVINILEVPVESLNSIHVGTKPLLNYQDQVYPFMHLATRLGVPPVQAKNRKVPVLLARSGGRQVAIQVDGLAGTREIVIKPLGPQMAGIEGLSGATILGDGSVVLILDVPGLWLTEEGLQVVRSARAAAGIAEPQPVVEEVAAEPARTRAVVMVVDDSITVRKVTQRHLQKRGIDVLLAKDGVDAMEQLRDNLPDVMLVDIEMPRMDGYELTQYVRSDSRLRKVPIIMITSRAGDKHRDKALALGVNLYMTKPYQEDTLYENINSLLPAHLASS